MASATVSWTPPGGGEPRVAQVPLPIADVAALRQRLAREFGLPGADFAITDTTKEALGDSDLAALRDGAALLVAYGGALAAPVRERISFQPHPKTLTMAGDYEYFAAQGRHPFVYALAEFVDNSLRATRRNGDRPREIAVTIATQGSGAALRGLVAVADNGCGMTKRELNEWAVMNYSMEERGAAPREPEAGGRGAGAAAGAAGAGRFLTSDISFFGVGSKNAAFFMGTCVKVATRAAGEPFVHELRLAAADLEARYRGGAAVYEEDMIHRNAGDASTLAPMEAQFAAAREWVAAEAAPGAGGADAGFTRVVIGDLKPDVLRQLAGEDGGRRLARELAHLYHYYLHGEGGNRAGGGAAAAGGRLPNGEALPAIELRLQADARLNWARRLADVDDDMETRLLRGQRAELPFALQVADRGTVSGVLWYFPYENDRETVPLEDGGGAAGGLGGPGSVPSAAPSPRPSPPAATQFVGRATQAPPGAGADDASDDEAPGASWSTPIFEAFWQGRLIPGARVETLPFIEAVRAKRSASAKDAVPDEAFGRLRGALFFGPAFRVTRNKLLFRDNLPDLLTAAVPADRAMERRLREWLARCHATLDKTVRFEALADSRAQAALRARLGEAATAFERVTDGARTVVAGDVVRIAAKPAVVGRVVCFTVPAAVREEGAYARGRVVVAPLPAEVHGPGALRDFSLRRLEGALDEKAVAEHAARELARLPAALRVEPMRFATGEALEFAAGDAVPDAIVAVLSGAGQRLVRAHVGGERVALTVTQRLWKLPAGGAAVPENGSAGRAGDDAAGAEEAAAARRAAKKARRGGRRAARADENADDNGEEGAGGAGAPAAAAELVLEVENRTPNQETFQFARLRDGLRTAGHYALEFAVGPAPPGQPPLRTVVPLVVRPGAPAGLAVEGEGRAALALGALALGAPLPPLRVSLRDAHGNAVRLGADAAGDVRLFMGVMNEAGAVLRCKELAVEAEAVEGDGCLVINALRVVGNRRAAAAAGSAGLALLRAAPAPTAPSAAGGAQRSASQDEPPTAEVFLCASLRGRADVKPELIAMRVRAGAAAALRLAPGGAWGEGGEAVVAVGAGAELPPLGVQAVDVWGNAAAPAEGEPFAVVAECAALAPAAREFAPDRLGAATLSGLVAATATTCEAPGWAPLLLSVRGGGAAEAAAAAPPLELRLRVEPSLLPARVRVLRGGAELPVERHAGDDGPVWVTILEGVAAGEKVDGLSMELLDESGAPAAHGPRGCVMVSWHRGRKKVEWRGEPLRLPAVVAATTTDGQPDLWVRFSGDTPHPVIVEGPLELRVVAGPPAQWSVALPDQPASQAGGETGVVECGRPFLLEVEALDAHGNRCGGDGLPTPAIALDAGGRPLTYDPAAWDAGWAAQGAEHVFAARLAMAGHPGDVTITVCDAAGPRGDSLLTGDSLVVRLEPGPAEALAFEGASVLETGTRATVPTIAVVLVDATGNPAPAREVFEVTLAPSALAVDGSGRAAKVALAGATRAKIARGATTAVFRGVALAAEAPGVYALRAQSASRKVALREGVLRVTMAPQNVATALRVRVPEELAAGGAAGAPARLLVEVDTEDSAPLAGDAAAAGLTLRLTPPGGGRGDAASVALAAGETEGAPPPTEGGAYVFALGELTAAGVYSAVAEWSEPRAEVRAGMARREAELRSATAQFEVAAGPPVAVAVEAEGAAPERCAVTNGAPPRGRLLVRGAAAQLLDAHGNAAGGRGVEVRFRLLLDGTPAGAGWEAPELVVAEGAAPRAADADGRAFAGDLSIAEGSGRAPGEPLALALVCEARGLAAGAGPPLEELKAGWATAWRCPVLFTDDAASFAAAEELAVRRAALAARRDALAGRADAARDAAAAARGAAADAAKAAQRLRKRAGGAAPETAAEAEARAAALEREAAEEGEGGAVRAPRHGARATPTTAAIDALLRAGDDGVVGVFAQLVTIEDEPLARAASYAARAALATLVVRDAAARERLAALAQAKSCRVPDMLPMALANTFRGRPAELPGLAGASPRARALTAAACDGSDPPLPAPLPHAQANAPGELAPNAWPAGCLGHLFNLVRPARPGLRARLLYGLLSGSLVFESLAEGAAYRGYVTRRLKAPFAFDIVTLDGGRISGRGVVAGDAYSPPPLAAADYVIGSSPAGRLGGAAGAAAAAAALRELGAALRAAVAAAAEADAAEAAAAAEESAAGGELAAVEAALAEVDARMGEGRPAAARAPGAAGRKRRGAPAEPEKAAPAKEPAEEPAEEPAPAEEAAGGRAAMRAKRSRLGKMQA